MTDRTMTEADLAFYAWLHASHPNTGLVAAYREAFMAGWSARMEVTGDGA